RGVAIGARQPAGAELHAAVPAYDDDRRLAQRRRLDRIQDRLARRSRRLARVGAALAVAQTKRPAVMRRIEVLLLDPLQLREECVIARHRKRDAEKIGALDLLPELGAL